MGNKQSRRSYFNEKYSEVSAIYAQLTELIDEMREEFGIEQELCDIMERTPLEEKLYQDVDYPAYKIFDSFETDLSTWIELAEAYDKEH